MKKIEQFIIYSLIISISISGQAQPHTLFKNLPPVKALKNFGMPIIEASAINNQGVLMTGGVAGISLNHFVTAVYGQWLLGGAKQSIENDELKLNFGHGGLWLGYLHRPAKPVHFTSNLQIGWGRARFKNKSNRQLVFQDQNLLVITPEVGININLYRYIKLHLTSGYRWVGGNSLPILGGQQLNSWTTKLTVVFIG